MKKYRYRDHAGTTQSSIDRAKKHLYKVGSIYKIRGYIHSDRTHVMVYGSRGTARFDAFAWGYGGTGPNGLIQLLKSLQANFDIADSEIQRVLALRWFGPDDDRVTNRTLWTINTKHKEQACAA